MREIVRRTRPWVNTFLSLPNVKYPGSVIWHERVLKMHFERLVHFKNETFKLFTATRKELMQ